jgi:Zn-dependent oligopeptidase
VTKLWNSLRQEISLVKGPDKPEPGHGSFSHLTGGYDAGYYGYLFSLVAATDMYSAVFAKNCLSPAAGMPDEGVLSIDG